MADQLQKFLSEKKSVIESVIDVFESGAVVVAILAVDIVPVVISQVAKRALTNVGEQRGGIHEEQFQKEVRKNEFLKHFSLPGGDRNLHTLYDAVTGDNFSGESVLETILNYEEKSRRPVEEFCAMLKKLFYIGLIALLGHAALVAELLFEKLPGDCVVHTVQTSKDLACFWSFSEELHYWEEHKNIYACVHSA
ncbi:unnamed protein product [Tetraodon nigroviridis]|uniref:(spotted green pufferfish) hypothetical protein n=1 Tax=Tetraodon nigroviridis TaxID=99883 RepID=Q4RE37_TETNG|nr:unnamed protein product [Tetraodon nigroviridis]